MPKIAPAIRINAASAKNGGWNVWSTNLNSMDGITGAVWAGKVAFCGVLCSTPIAPRPVLAFLHRLALFSKS